MVGIVVRYVARGGGREDSNHVSERWPQAVSVASRAGRWWFCLLKEVSILLMTPRGINVEKKKEVQHTPGRIDP